MAVSMELAPGTLLRLTQCCPAERDGRVREDAGQCRRGHKGFSQEPGQEEDSSKSWTGENGGGGGGDPYTSQELSLPTARPSPGLCQSQKASGPPKPAGLSWGADAPLNGKSPRSSSGVPAGSKNSQQQRPKTCSVAKSTRALWGTETWQKRGRGAGKCAGLQGHSSQPHAILTDFSDSGAFSYRSYNYITEFLCKLLSFIN